MPDELDVVIVGCGPVGAVAGILSAQAGFRTLVIERQEEVFPLPRAIHFDAQIMRLFQSVGLADDIAPLVCQWHRSVFTGADGELLRVHEFPTEWVQAWAPHYLFDQPAVERVLRERLLASGATLALGTGVEDLVPAQDGVSLVTRQVATGREGRVESRWVIGCDGASSTVRQRLGIALEDKSFDEPWLVVDARVPSPEALPRDSHMICDPRRPSTVINGPRDLFRWELMLLPGEESAAMERDEVVWELLSPWVDRCSASIVRAAVYRFHALVAHHWRRDRVFLAGDAAHQTPPFLGQGMCHGLRDVENLIWKLRAADRGGAEPALLETYQEERATHVHEIIEMAVASGREICELDPGRAEVRDTRVRAESREGRLPVSPFSGMPPLRHGLLGGGYGAGHLFPQPVVTLDGVDRRLDDIVGRRPYVVALDNAGGEGVSSPSDATGLRVWVLDLRDGLNLTEEAAVRLRDGERVVARWMELRGTGAAVVRPDRYAYATSSDLRQVSREAEMLCGLLTGTEPPGRLLTDAHP